MSSKWFVILSFIAGAALSWGVYVPLVHRAASELGTNLRAFLMVGIAYFLVAVLVPVFFIFLLGNDPTLKPGVSTNWAAPSILWGLLAGFSGAVGALCVIFASKNAGALLGPTVGPLVVAPLVFAGAPIINTIASMTIFAHGPMEKPSPSFYLGLFVAAAGMALVMINKPNSLSSAHSKPGVAAPASPADVKSPAAAH